MHRDALCWAHHTLSPSTVGWAKARSAVPTCALQAVGTAGFTLCSTADAWAAFGHPTKAASSASPSPPVSPAPPAARGGPPPGERGGREGGASAAAGE